MALALPPIVLAVEVRCREVQGEIVAHFVEETRILRRALETVVARAEGDRAAVPDRIHPASIRVAQDRLLKAVVYQEHVGVDEVPLHGRRHGQDILDRVPRKTR